MGCPKNSTVSRRNNISRTATHKCDGAPDDCTPEEVKGNGNISESIEGAPVWTMMMSQSKYSTRCLEHQQQLIIDCCS